MFTLKNLRILGFIEGTSFLILIGIAMPVKYLLAEPMLVRVVGSAHGILFILYVLQLALTATRNTLPWWAFPLGFVGAVIPFGPFLFEYLLSRSQAESVAS